MLSSVSKLAKGSYLYGTTEGHALNIRKNFYNGTWGIWHVDAVGAPAFALGFATKKEAVEFLDDNLGPSENDA